MKTVATYRQIPVDAVRADKQSDGSWICYEKGDVLPVDPPAPTDSRLLTAQQFRDRFTNAEMDSILDIAGAAIPDKTARRIIFQVQTNRVGIHLDDNQVTNGLTYLVSKGCITAARRAEILS